jgi:hypothetical protein
MSERRFALVDFRYRGTTGRLRDPRPPLPGTAQDRVQELR